MSKENPGLILAGGGFRREAVDVRMPAEKKRLKRKMI